MMNILKNNTEFTSVCYRFLQLLGIILYFLYIGILTSLINNKITLFILENLHENKKVQV